jgi:CDP-diacylglycerol--glycerol-3-phosphate 3-phosphatidyltransferase
MPDKETHHAHIRDMPEPRDNPSLTAPFLKRSFTWLFKVILAGIMRLGLKPWHLTVMGLAMNVLVGALLLQGMRVLPGLLLIPAGALDLFDGAVARMRGEESRMGAFVDSGLDRVSDGIVFGCLYWSLAEQGQDLAAALCLAVLGVSLGVSYVRAAAEARGVALGEGLFQRLERYVALCLGLWIPGALVPALVILLVLGGITLLQRIWGGARRLSKAEHQA